MFTKKHLYIGTIIVSSSALIFTYGFNFFNTGGYRNTLTSKAIEQNISSTSSAADQKAETDLHNDPEAAPAPVNPQVLQGQQDSQTLLARDNPKADETTISRGGERVLPKQTTTGELILEKGVTSEEVTKLQQNFRKLGYLNTEPTGYFGELTLSAVINFQKNNSMTPDGQAGPHTVLKIEEAVKSYKPVSLSTPTPKESAGGAIQLLPWFSTVNGIYSIGSVATVTDVDSGLSFKAKRTYGNNHADVETLTYADTEILRKISGGQWNWTRRAVIVEVGGHRIAGSLTAMPHAGRDDKPANAYVDGRSSGYGSGTNLDAVKGNGMDGQFDIHFYGSKTHSTNRVDNAHQEAIQEAYKSGK